MVQTVRLKKVERSATQDYNYVTQDGRFTVARQTGGLPRFWWLVTDTQRKDQKGQPKLVECDSLGEAREHIADVLETETAEAAYDPMVVYDGTGDFASK